MIIKWICSSCSVEYFEARTKTHPQKTRNLNKQATNKSLIPVITNNPSKELTKVVATGSLRKENGRTIIKTESKFEKIHHKRAGLKKAISEKSIVIS